MTTEERIRPDDRTASTAGTAACPEARGLIAVLVPQSRSYQHFDARRRFLVTSIELWHDRVLVHVTCPPAPEAAALPNLRLQDNAETRYECTTSQVTGRRVMLTFAPAAPETIRTLSVRPPHPVSGSAPAGCVTAVRLTATAPKGGRLRRTPPATSPHSYSLYGRAGSRFDAGPHRAEATEGQR
jgi:hypothetical protein